VKVQCFSPDELVALRGDGPAPDPWGAQGWSVRDLYEKARTPFEWFADLFAWSREIGIVPFASFFGHESFAVLQSVNCGAYKLASLDREHEWLRDLAKSARKPVIASIPEREQELPNDTQYLLCPEGYPQRDLALSFEHFHDQSDCGGWGRPFAGFSYHGTDRRVPLAAATLGAKLVEFHFMLEHEPSELERAVSLTQHDTFWMIEDVRAMEAVTA
jgi:sialic acid synthase SpsE